MDVWLVQTVIRPRRHSSHVPSGIAAMTCTRSPRDQPDRSAPISTTSPAISWPMTRGGLMFWCPLLKILTSVPQVEQLRTRILISSAAGVGSSISSRRTSPGA